METGNFKRLKKKIKQHKTKTEEVPNVNFNWSMQIFYFLIGFDSVSFVVVVVVLIAVAVVVAVVRADDQKYGNKATAITALEIQNIYVLYRYIVKIDNARVLFFSSLVNDCMCVCVCANLCVYVLKPICCIKSTELDDGVGAFGSRLKCYV